MNQKNLIVRRKYNIIVVSLLKKYFLTIFFNTQNKQKLKVASKGNNKL